MAIDPLPTPPSRNDDPDTFVERADAFVAALGAMVDQVIEQFSLVISGLNYNTVSTSSVAVGSGSKSFTAETGKLLQLGQWVNIASSANPANFMFGEITSYNASTGALVVNVSTVGGSGTHADWVISLSPTGAAGADEWNRSQTFRTTGTPAIVDSTNSTAKKIELRDANVMKGGIGTGTSGANLMDSAGTARVEASTTGVTLTGAVAATDAISATKNNAGTFFGLASINSNTGSSSASVCYVSANGSNLELTAYAPAVATYGNKVAMLAAGTATAIVTRIGGTPQTEVTSSGLFLVNHGTTASAANAFINSGSSPVGQLLRSTSSEWYKTNIEDVEQAYLDAALSIRAVYYRSHPEHAPNDNPDYSHWGHIAEEVAAIDPRLVHWGYQERDFEDHEVLLPEGRDTGEKDDDGKPIFETVMVPYIEKRLKEGAELRPDGAQYERINLLKIEALRRQNVAQAEQIAALAARLEAAGL